jgi:hypothetical protein
MSLYVNSAVAIDRGCPLAITVHSPERAGILCGWPPQQTVQMSLGREALRALVELGIDALAKMDAAAGAATTVSKAD